MNRRNTRGSVSREIPMPVSLTLITASYSVVLTVNQICPCRSVYLATLFSKLPITCAG